MKTKDVLKIIFAFMAIIFIISSCGTPCTPWREREGLCAGPKELDIPPGPQGPQGNMVRNGDFSEGEIGWSNRCCWGMAKGTVSFDNGEMHVNVTKQGTDEWHFQIQNWGHHIVEGRTFVVSFKARSPQSRKIQVRLGRGDPGPYDHYLEEQDVKLTPEMKEYSFEFKMNKYKTNENAVLDINLAGDVGEVFIDDVDVREKGS